jgi:uncharacterized protein (DUF1499 family)
MKTVSHERILRLADCPVPSCASTQATKPARLVPALQIIGEPLEAMTAVQQLLSTQKRTRIVRMSADYIHAEARSFVFRFVDDIEFLVDDEALLQFRSAARVGYWDFGVNRRRMDRLRTDLLNRYGSLFKEMNKSSGF